MALVYDVVNEKLVSSGPINELQGDSIYYINTAGNSKYYLTEIKKY